MSAAHDAKLANRILKGLVFGAIAGVVVLLLAPHVPGLHDGARWLAALGEFPERTPLDARVLGTLRREGYRIEKVLYESRPSHHVTAALYLPETGGGRVPGVLVPCGHDAVGKAAARTTLIDAMNAGAALTGFVGHSSLTTWSFERLFSATDAAALKNAGKPTVVTQWGCWNTYYVSPAADTMAHKLLLSGDRGAAAVLGSSTLTLSSSEALLGALVTPRLTAPGMRIGDAILEAKRELAESNTGLVDVQLGWNLLGDPALVVDPAD